MMGRYIDQLAHFLAAVMGLAPAALLPGTLTFAWAGFCMGMVREVTEEGGPVTPAKVLAALHSWRDLLFWTAGGLLVGLVSA